MIKIISREQWDYHVNYQFIFLTDDNQYIGRCSLSLTELSLHLQSFYIDDKMRGKGYSTQILQEVIEYSNEFIQKDIKLLVRKDNFIYKKYKELGFKKCKNDEEYDWLKLKYKKVKAVK